MTPKAELPQQHCTLDSRPTGFCTSCAENPRPALAALASAQTVVQWASREPSCAKQMIADGAPSRSSGSHENRLLASLPLSDMARLSSHLHVTSIEPGAVLQLQGHPTEYVYFPHEGLVSLLATTSDGQMIQAASVGRAGAICPVRKLDVHEGFLTAIALTGMQVSRIDLKTINEAQQERETIREALRGCREEVLFQLRQNIVCCGVHSAKHRLSRWMLETADRLGRNVTTIPVGQGVVGQCLGVRRTTITLMARNLRERGAIRWGRSRVEIMDRALLESMVCPCYAALRERTNRAFRIP